MKARMRTLLQTGCGRIMHRVPVAVFAATACFVVAVGLCQSCMHHRVYSIRPSALRVDGIAIGPIDVAASSSVIRPDQIREAIAFEFRRAGFRVLDITRTDLPQRESTPATEHLLGHKDLALLAGRIPARLLLQGSYEEVRERGVSEDHWHIVLSIQVHDLRLNRPAGSILIYAEDLPSLRPAEAMELASRIRSEMADILPDPRGQQ